MGATGSGSGKRTDTSREAEAGRNAPQAPFSDHFKAWRASRAGPDARPIGAVGAATGRRKASKPYQSRTGDGLAASGGPLRHRRFFRN